MPGLFRRILNAGLGVLIGYVGLVVFSLVTMLALGDLVASDPLQGWGLTLDFLFAIFAVAVSGWLATKVGNPWSAYALAILIGVATVAAPAPNWPTSASVAYAVIAAIGLVGLGLWQFKRVGNADA